MSGQTDGLGHRQTLQMGSTSKHNSFITFFDKNDGLFLHRFGTWVCQVCPLIIIIIIIYIRDTGMVRKSLDTPTGHAPPHLSEKDTPFTRPKQEEE